MNWINTKDRLPEEGKYVLVRHSRRTWHDSDDQANVNCVVAKMKSEDGNSKLPYHFITFGSGSFNGDSITHWMPIEPIN